MPDPTNDRDQIRFAQIRGRMINSLVKNMPQTYVESSGAKDREEFREKLAESSIILSIVDCCAYEAQCIEEERARVRR